MNKRNLIRHFFLASLIATSGLFADYSNVQQMPAQQQVDEVDLYNKNEPAFLASAEFLWWTVQEDATDYAIKMTKPVVNSLRYPQGNYKTGEFDWDPGYRLTLGYFNAPKFWEIYGQYSWIYVSGSNSANKPDAENLFLRGTLGKIFPTDDLILRATSKIGFLYHLADLIIDRVFIPNPHLRLRLLGGLTGTRVTQNWRVKHYEENNIESIRHKWRFTGIGFRLGLAMDWFLGADFYLTGKWSSAILIGRYHNWFTQKVLIDPDASLDTSFKDYRPAFTSQFLLGPSWQKSLENARIEIFAGYELTPWFNLQENFRRTSSTSSDFVITHNRSLILLQGLTARLTVDF